jgi:hypothetical protein
MAASSIGGMGVFMQRILCAAAVSTSLIVGAACESRSPFRLPEAPTPASPTSSLLPVPQLAGTYTVTILADSACVDLPNAAKKRTYQATLESTPYEYFGISIVGGGFTQPVVVGELWYRTNGLNWNNFDIGGCDGQKEPLGPSSALMICGDAKAEVVASTITAKVSGKIWVEELVNGNPQQTSVCTGLHQFTFEPTKK